VKLISLYIENFGGLSRYSLSFEDGLTVIEAENGFGKTTLAEFIRAMFYGFPRKAKTLDKSRRQKFTPWNGGKFGGNLIFESEGIVYRLERSFGATPKADSFLLTDLNTGKKSNRFSEEIGLELFGLDADAFERSTYLPQMAETGSLTSDSIRSKLSNLVEDTNDVGNFEKAVAALKTKRSTYVPYRGSGGSVAQASGQISCLQEQLRRTEEQKTELEQAEQDILRLRQEQETIRDRQGMLRNQIRQASEAAAAKSVQRQHRDLTQRYEAAENIRRRLEEKYPTAIPDWNSMEQARNAAARLEILHSQEVTEQDDLDALAFVEKNSGRFASHTPAEEELAACRNRCSKLDGLRSRTMELAEKLTQNPPVQAKPWPVVLLLLAFIGEAGLGISLLREKTVFAYIALGIGAAALVFGVFAAVQLMKNRKKLQQFHEEQAAIRMEMDRLTGEAEQQEEQIRDFLSAYGPVSSGNYYGALVELEHDAQAYLRAVDRVARWQQEKEQHGAEIAKCSGVLDGFFASAGLVRQERVRGQLLQIRDDRKDWEEAVEEAGRLGRELEAFRQEHSQILSQQIPADLADPETLLREENLLMLRLNGCSEALIRQQQRREQLLAQVQRIPELRDELQRWQEKKNADQKKSDLLDDTVAFLEQAKENLAVSYMGPIRISFAEYLRRLWEDQPGQTLVTQDLEVQLERYGQVRELGYFSAGQSDLVMLCMRFALVDALFGEVRPCVILDDPFVNLDDAHTKQALELLKELSENRQILYLTCSSSRVPQ